MRAELPLSDSIEFGFITGFEERPEQLARFAEEVRPLL